MTTISNGTFVSLHFQLYSEDGQQLGGTEEEPLRYIHGMMPLDPPGLQQYLEGKSAGHEGEVILPPALAYGEKMLSTEESMAQIPLDTFPPDLNVATGMMFMAAVGDKGELPITIIDVQGDVAIVHYGHPLAGHTIRIAVQILEAREHTPEDLQSFSGQ